MTTETPANRVKGSADKDIALYSLSMSYTTRSNSQIPAILMILESGPFNVEERTTPGIQIRRPLTKT